ncbi:type 1 glutamine amidotransferase domain-containing protein [Microbacterium sp. M3]|uniref:Type 1 glutamine amidotransferase domain-containing protein n=1 Tax=Microbacterium arthrosphaerae TaxID=792652 RepID=A0ABU4H4Q1_9MICO|nr:MULTISPECIES: type 1 glutamine amidotransferase domain-containing protein [Microbacterium]MDW4574215.1 type 1 glutamine amidotransferase domain-containing protein [Microbacterium arthrosphaerae]MDW7608070.1 type 1 glutamine amidotransferase domain-containing protein [Microbacterium sp. M3]
MAHVLMVVTAADAITLGDGTAHPTGFWAEELVELHRGLVAAGHGVDLATPGGARPPVDPGSLTGDAEESLRAYLAEIDALLAHSRALADVAEGEYDAIVLPGGHGPMVDLAADADLGRLLVDAVDREAVIGVLCHGPAGLLSAVREDGSFAFSGRRLTVFSDEEERQGGLGEGSPYLVESRLRELGALIEPGAPWSVTVVSDGTLVSGQNPQSSVATAQAIVDVLAAR